MTFSPKETFAKSSMAQPWTDVVSSQLFREAVGAAMLQMQANQGFSKDQWDAIGHSLQMEGARAFLSILMNLTTPPSEIPQRPRSENLRHDV